VCLEPLVFILAWYGVLVSVRVDTIDLGVGNGVLVDCFVRVDYGWIGSLARF
jgi:hypothetical protein